MVIDLLALVVPTLTVPKPRLETDAVRGDMPTPWTPKVSGLTMVLSVRETAPLMVPFEEGLKDTVIVQVATGAKVVTQPVAVKSPFAATAEIFTDEALVFLTTTVLLRVEPAATLPNDSEEGVNVRGAVAPLVPVPDRETSCGLRVAL